MFDTWQNARSPRGNVTWDGVHSEAYAPVQNNLALKPLNSCTGISRLNVHPDGDGESAEMLRVSLPPVTYRVYQRGMRDSGI